MTRNRTNERVRPEEGSPFETGEGGRRESDRAPVYDGAENGIEPSAHPSTEGARTEGEFIWVGADSTGESDVDDVSDADDELDDVGESDDVNEPDAVGEFGVTDRSDGEDEPDEIRPPDEADSPPNADVSTSDSDRRSGPVEVDDEDGLVRRVRSRLPF